jgi:ElaB/YqjD/DUF883 family membrane-anchored ribosome-binding protein
VSEPERFATRSTQRQTEIHRMLTTLRVLLALSIGWSALALAAQVLRAWGGGRTDHARSQGTPMRGVVYNFTTAMTPAHKESVRNHPAKFAVGMALHVGLLLSLLVVVIMMVHVETGVRAAQLLRYPAIVSLVAGVYLAYRRTRDTNLQAMSSPDDFLAILCSCGLLLLIVALPHHLPWAWAALLTYGTLLFIYLPLGKLRHIVFFFVARGDYGRRLGYRGVYPPASASME